MNINRQKTRRGTASLEFVLGLPMVLGLGALIMTIGIAAVHKSVVTSQVRHTVWKDRATVKTSKALNVFSSPTAGSIEGSKSSTFAVYQWLGGSQTAKSQTAVLGGTWDHTEIKSFTDRPKGPHVGTIVTLVGLPQSVGTVIDTMLALLTFTSLPNQGEIDNAGEKADEAKKEADKKKKENEETLARMKAELAQLEQEMAALQSERQAKENEIDRLNDELDDLQNNGGSQADINAKKQQIKNAEKELDDIKQKIKVKQQQIDQKKRDIKKWEDAMADAQDAENDIPTG